MSDDQRQDHVVVTVSIKKVRFVKATNQGSAVARVAQSMAADGLVRQVGDVLQFSVTGTTVEAAVDRAHKMMGVVDNDTPVTNLKHSDINGGVQR